ncbi:MAG TPA: NrsF family protein [Alphaproteobacteria bacterium]|nr:NrsF family protein [Alphaproteobacteria bacterium]
MRTKDLIAILANDSRSPVHRLPSPSVRLIKWLAVSAPWIALVVAVMHLRPDLGTKLAEPRWLLEQGAALATAVTAGMAALCAGVPGRPRWERWLAAGPVLVWLGTLGLGCVQDWIQSGPVGVSLQPDWECLPGIVLVGLVPGVVMVALLRRLAPLVPVVSVGLGGLSAAALADFALRLFHTQDAGAMVLVWQVGTVALLSAASAAIGRHILCWRHLRAG